MKEKNIIETITSLKEYDDLLKKYNYFYTKYNYLPGVYRKLSIDKKNSLYNRLNKNLEIINDLMDKIRNEREKLKNKKNNEKIIKKLVSYQDYYITLFNYKLEYGLLDYIKEDISNPKELDKETKYKLQLADIDFFSLTFLQLDLDQKSRRINELICDMKRASDRSNSSIKIIKEIENAIINNDFDSLSKTIDNKNLSIQDRITHLQTIKNDLNLRIRHNDAEIDFYKSKLSKILKKEINF